MKILIHIGKCGGVSVRNAILDSGRLHIDEIVHIRQPRITPDATYYILARSPVPRAISAFNWRYRLVVEESAQPDRFPGERQILENYGRLSVLAEALYFEDGSDNVLAQGNYMSIHHLGEGISFYLDRLLGSIPPTQVGGVLLQENLNNDMFRLFGIITKERANANQEAVPEDMLQLSEKAHANLRRFLRSDFACLEKLNQWGKISDEGWNRLSL